MALLDFKKRISEDPLQIMRSWNDSTHFCYWFGVTCSPSRKRVIVLNLESQRLGGTITPSLGNLTYLTGINLINNSMFGEIPQELGRLRRLQHLNLTLNYFGGSLPTNLSHCTQLRVLNVPINKLVGKIPEEFSSLSKLVYLQLGGNNLTGTIPVWIGNFSSLSVLTFPLNNLQGSIPIELGHLSSLEFFQLYGNNLSGPIPVSLSNASRLSVLDFSVNGLTGMVPQNLVSLGALVHLNFYGNRLGNGKVGDLNFLGFLANCTSLEILGLGFNQFGGALPSFVANLFSQLKRLHIGRNMIDGGIPIGIGNLVSLTDMQLDGNYLGGPLSDALGKLQQLQVIGLSSVSISLAMSHNSLTEYGMDGQVSVFGDIYSYGVLLLEIFTGKRATDDMFKDGLSIHKFTELSSPQRVMDIVGSSIPFEEDADDETNTNGIEVIKEVDRHFNAKCKVEECLVSVSQVGLLCCATSPYERLPTNDVVNKLRTIRDTCVHHRGQT
ncbi:putative receptor-like protein kinase At3g47110 [Corylus avellana]|uniref:putative receptor-like protein kinase At3g47110 n=1 Tax=Corylus avellana TaxID=13451 RepID=UPI00286B2EA5|nr:putative receptor-like protein kinase At3g47110 [Corylus avellana]